MRAELSVYYDGSTGNVGWNFEFPHLRDTI